MEKMLPSVHNGEVCKVQILRTVYVLHMCAHDVYSLLQLMVFLSLSVKIWFENVTGSMCCESIIGMPEGVGVMGMS